MLVKTYSSALFGIEAFTVTIEVHCGKGTKTNLVGLPDNAVKESLLRIYTASNVIGSRIPMRGYTINMAPADLRKEGSAYDLAIACGLLASAELVSGDLFQETLFVGELGLDGSVQAVKGALVIALEARKQGFQRLVLPEVNALEAAVVSDIDIIPVSSLKDLIDFLNGSKHIEPLQIDPVELFRFAPGAGGPDLSEVKGQTTIKRAIEIAAAGSHNILLIGPPGAGKTMIAKRIPGILPMLSMEEALETTKIHSVAGSIRRSNGLLTSRPFRNPHHTISDVALVGGGSNPQPGEISLAHNGVLFMDELPEFKRSVLEVMRQPLEERRISVSRARFSVDYPANFMLVASMNPCPCGYYNHPEKACTCPSGAVERYLSRVSGPLLDRIDLHVEVAPVDFNRLSSVEKEETSEDVRKRVVRARTLQKNRYSTNQGVYSNAQMNSKLLQRFCRIDESSLQLLKTAMERLQLSARAYDRILKVARTIADLDEKPEIEPQHLAEAIQYRSLDRENWGK
ncbi:MAG: YifB family Mg chelatase-like AAA ATPase [Flavobacteriales bacterium]|nr:YifB family Mg chelatase-like AAA ATPase [Flavobacteriales bacterium]